MKTTKEMIEVMQAFERGEQIQVKTPNKKCEWEDIKEPNWQWNFCDYRVKPKKKKYVPFDTAEEFLAAQREHGKFVFKDDGYNEHFEIYVNKYCMLVARKPIKGTTYIMRAEKFLIYFKFADGTPCGKEVEA